MFNLDSEIQAWCRDVLGEAGSPLAAELEDHVRCAIESAVAGGVGEEQAFRQATADLAEVRALAREPERNRKRILKLCALAGSGTRCGGPPTSRRERRQILGQSIVWAAVILASALLSSDSDQGGQLLLILIAGWFASTYMVAQGLDPRSEWQCFRRWLAGRGGG